MNAHDDSSAGSRREVLRERDDAVIARLATLATVLDAEPDPDFRVAARTRLVAMAAVRTPGTPDVVLRPPLRLRWRRLKAALAAAAVVATALAALLTVAVGAGPGDPLYGVKRGAEQTELALAGDSRRGPVLLDLARERLAEVRTLVGAPAPEPGLVLPTLHTMDAQTAEGAAWFDARAIDSRSTAPLDQLAHWTAGQSSGLQALRGHLPSTMTAALEHSFGVLTAVRTRADAVRAALPAAARPPSTGTSGGTASIGRSPGAPTSVAGGRGPVGTSSLPSGNGGPPLAPAQATVPTRPSPGASGGLGGVLPPAPVPGASAPGGGLPLPTVAVPSGSAVCVGPLSVSHC